MIKRYEDFTHTVYGHEGLICGPAQNGMTEGLKVVGGRGQEDLGKEGNAWG